MNLNELRESRQHNRDRVEAIKEEMAATERNRLAADQADEQNLP